MTSPIELRSVAEEATRRAGRILVEKARTQRIVELKQGIDPVTDADEASEAELLRFLRQVRPGDSILAEESGRSGAGGLVWYVDPLDGTFNYARGIPVYCVSVAVGDSSGLLAGAIFDPVRGELFSAAKGHGATLNGERISVSEVRELDRAALCVGFPYDVRRAPEPTMTLVSWALRRAHGVLRTGSAALNLAYVACGRFDGHFQLGLKPWDVAAGALIVSEAGGLLSCIDGAPLDLSAGDVIAANPHIWPALGAELAEVLAKLGWSRIRKEAAT